MKLSKIQKLNLAGIMLIPMLWYLVTDLLTLCSPVLLPSLNNVLNRLYELVFDGAVFNDVFATLKRWSYGFFIGIFLGILVGLILGMFNSLRKMLEFPLEFIRCMPVTAIFPLFLIVFGIGDSSKIAMAFMPTFLLMVVNTSYGVTLSDTTRRKMAKVFGANPWQIFRTVIILDALPQIFVGLRLALSQSLIVTVVSEMFIGTDFGLGQRVYDSYLTSSTTTLYSLLIILGVIGYLVNKLLLMIESRLVFWTGR